MIILVCDLGGTRMKIGVVRQRQVLAQTVVPRNSKMGIVAGFPVLKETWLRLLSKLKLSIRDCEGIVVAFASLVDPRTGGVLAEYGKYADAMKVNLREWARREFNLPLAIENDARMAAVGEWLSGACRGIDNFVMITLGTGIGTAAIIEGQVLRGAHGQAGVLGGHFTVNYCGRECNCGNLGCAEAEASTAFLSEIVKTRADFAASKLANEPVLDFAAVFRLSARGDICAQAIRDRSLRVWSSVAVNLIHAYDPEVVILGGGIMTSGEVIQPFVQNYVDRHAHTPWGKVKVLASELKDGAAFAAAEWLLNEQSKWLFEKAVAK